MAYEPYIDTAYGNNEVRKRRVDQYVTNMSAYGTFGEYD